MDFDDQIFDDHPRQPDQHDNGDGGDLNDLDLSGYQREARPPRQSRVRERIKQRKQTPQAVKTGVLTPST
ncbi:MAG: hypothetical protein H7Y11_11585, partial [Armatimonadetes bacterium]|nr:hypothetical protein [Anaerolineae bacterium]